MNDALLTIPPRQTFPHAFGRTGRGQTRLQPSAKKICRQGPGVKAGSGNPAAPAPTQDLALFADRAGGYWLSIFDRIFDSSRSLKLWLDSA